MNQETPEQILARIIDVRTGESHLSGSAFSAIAAAIKAERDRAEKAENERDMYIDKVSDLGMEAQREVQRRHAMQERAEQAERELAAVEQMRASAEFSSTLNMQERNELVRLRCELKEAEKLMEELHGTVLGECPSLLNEDSGGCEHLDIAIKEWLERRRTAK